MFHFFVVMRLHFYWTHYSSVTCAYYENLLIPLPFFSTVFTAAKLTSFTRIYFFGFENMHIRCFHLLLLWFLRSFVFFFFAFFYFFVLCIIVRPGCLAFFQHSRVTAYIRMICCTLISRGSLRNSISISADYILYSFSSMKTRLWGPFSAKRHGYEASCKATWLWGELKSDKSMRPVIKRYGYEASWKVIKGYKGP